MENSGEISVAQALNQLQSWLNAGEFEKVMQGAHEVLILEPGNQRALSLMKQAEERRHDDQFQGIPSAPKPTTPPPSLDPLKELKVEDSPEDILEFQTEEDDRYEKKKLILAILIPAIIVVLLGGMGVWMAAKYMRADNIDKGISDKNGTEDIDSLSYLDANEERLITMTNISEVLYTYKVKNGTYPDANKVESVLTDSGYFTAAPSDPRQGEVDKAGKEFGYVYAVYDGIGGENSVYVLSALFEDSKGFGYAWSKGGPIRNYPDYRSVDEDNVTFIGEAN